MLAGAAEAGHGLFNFRFQIGEGRFLKDRRVQRGAAQGEVVEGDVEEPVVRSCPT